MKSTSRRTTSDALEILDRIAGNDNELREAIEQATFNAQIAELIYASRRQAGLTQKQLAALIGSTQPVIARLENADYEGHSLTMLRRLGEALGFRLELRFVRMEDVAEAAEQPVSSREKEHVVSAAMPRRHSGKIQERVPHDEPVRGEEREAAGKRKGRQSP